MGLPFTAPAERKIGDIQVLRGIAVVTVIFQHLHLSTGLFNQFTNSATPPSWMAVDLFFVISGFVIAGALFRDRFEPFAFIVKRAFRLLPAALIFIGLCLLLNLYFMNRDLNEYAKLMYAVDWRAMRKMSVAIVGGYYSLQRYGCALYGGMWSLSVEDQFYAGLAVFCLAVAIVFRRHAAKVLPALVCAGAVGIYLYGFALRMQIVITGNGINTLSRYVNYFLFHRFDLLALGVVLAFANRRFGPTIAKLFQDRGPFLTPFLLVGPFVLVSLTGPSYTNQTMGVGITVAGLCFGLLTLAAAHDLAMPPTRGWVYRAWTFLGDRSYSIYLFHFAGMALAWIVIDNIFPKYGGVKVHATTALLQLLLVPLLTLPIVEVVFRWVEQPMTAVGRKVAKRVRILPAEDAPKTLPLREAA